MTWLKLRGKFLSPGFDKALFTIGQIVVALQAISSFLNGLSSIVQGFMALLGGKIDHIISIFFVILGVFQVALGYGYFFLLDMNKSGRLVSLARFFCEIGAGLSIVLSPFILLIGFIMLFKNLQVGSLIIASGGIMLCGGFGLNYFLEERERIQIAKQASESVINQVSN